MKIDVTIRSPRLRAMSSLLSEGGRVKLHQAMGEAVREKTRTHLAVLAQTRHATAQRLGAAPSGHLEQAARAVGKSAITADASGAELTLQHIGMIRALRDVTIRPGGGRKFLTIPIHALAYNRRAGEFDDLFAAKGKLFQSRGKGQPPLALYLLVRSVTQRQDRTLLPSEQEWKQAAVDAVEALTEANPA